MTSQGGSSKGMVGVQHALSQPERAIHEVKATATVSPRALFEAAMSSPPITQDDLTAHRCAWLAVAARDDAKRVAPTPQVELPLGIAA